MTANPFYLEVHSPKHGLYQVHVEAMRDFDQFIERSYCDVNITLRVFKSWVSTRTGIDFLDADRSLLAAAAVENGLTPQDLTDFAAFTTMQELDAIRESLHTNPWDAR